MVTLDLSVADSFPVLMRGEFVANEKRGVIDVLGRVTFEDPRAEAFCIMNGHPRFADVEVIRFNGAPSVTAARAALAERGLLPAIGRALFLYAVEPAPRSDDELVVALGAALVPQDTLRPYRARQYLGLYRGSLGFYEEPFLGINTAFLGMRYV